MNNGNKGKQAKTKAITVTALLIVALFILSAVIIIFPAHSGTRSAPPIVAQPHSVSYITITWMAKFQGQSEVKWTVSSHNNWQASSQVDGNTYTNSTTWYASNNSGNTLRITEPELVNGIGYVYMVTLSSNISGLAIWPNNYQTYGFYSPSTIYEFFGSSYQVNVTEASHYNPSATITVSNSTYSKSAPVSTSSSGHFAATSPSGSYTISSTGVAGWTFEGISYQYSLTFQNAQYTPTGDGNVLSSENTIYNSTTYSITYYPDITFTETGLAAGIAWTATIDGNSASSTASSVIIPTAIGKGESWSVFAQDWSAKPSSGTLNVTGPANISSSFTPLGLPMLTEYNANFTLTGLFPNSSMNLSVGEGSAVLSYTPLSVSGHDNIAHDTINNLWYTDTGYILHGGQEIGTVPAIVAITQGVSGAGFVAFNKYSNLLYFAAAQWNSSAYRFNWVNILVYKTSSQSEIVPELVANYTISSYSATASGGIFSSQYPTSIACDVANGYTYIATQYAIAYAPYSPRIHGGFISVLNGTSLITSINTGKYGMAPDQVAVSTSTGYAYVGNAAAYGTFDYNILILRGSAVSVNYTLSSSFEDPAFVSTSNGYAYIGSEVSPYVAVMHGTSLVGQILLPSVAEGCGFMAPVPGSSGVYYPVYLSYPNIALYEFMKLSYPTYSVVGQFTDSSGGYSDLQTFGSTGSTIIASGIPSSGYRLYPIINKTLLFEDMYNGSVARLELPNGIYSVSASAGSDYTAVSTVITISNKPFNSTLAFTPVRAPLTFIEVGLPSNIQWAVAINGQTYTSVSSTLTITLPIGNYTYTAADIQGYRTQNTGSVALTQPTIVEIVYQSTINTYLVTFNEHGLPTDAMWAVTFNGRNVTSTSSSITFPATNGSYSYSVPSIPRFRVSPSSGIISVAGTDQNISLRFTFISEIVVYETGLPNATQYSFHIGGTAYSTSKSYDIINATTGLYNFTVFDVNVSGQSGTIITYQPDVVTGYINLGKFPYLLFLNYKPNIDLSPVTFVENGLRTGTAWGVDLNNTISWSVNQNITYYMSNGQYLYAIQNITGYRPQNDPVMTVNGSTIINVPFAPVPVAEMTYSSPIYAGTTEIFSAADSFTFAGTITNYTWSFTGNAIFTKYGENISAKLSQGTYYVNLTVENSYNNTASTYATVYVYPAEASFVVRTNLNNGSAWLKSVGLSKNVSWTFTVFHGTDPARHFYLGNALPAADATEQNYTLQYSVGTQNASFSLLNDTFSYTVNLTHRFVLFNGSILAHYPYGGKFMVNGSSSVNLIFGENIPGISISIPTYVPADTAWSFTPNVTDYIGLNTTDPLTSIASIKYKITGPQDFNGTGSDLTIYFAKRGVYDLTITATNNWGYSRVFVSSIAVTAFTHVLIPITVTRLNNSDGYLEYEMVVTTNLTISNVQLHIDNSSYVGLTFISQSHVSGNVYSYEYTALVNPRNFTYAQHTLNFSVYTTNGDYNWLALNAKFGSSSGGFNIIGAFGGLTNFLIVIFTGGGLAVAYAGVRTSKKGDIILRESNGKEQVIEAQNIQKKHRLFGNKKMKGRNGK